jgi:hypothetical protein
VSQESQDEVKLVHSEGLPGSDIGIDPNDRANCSVEARSRVKAKKYGPKCAKTARKRMKLRGNDIPARV